MTFHFTDIKHYQEQLLSGSISCNDAVNHYLAEIEKSKRLNAFVDVYGDEARGTADRLDRAREAGEPMKRLHGVVVAIKDVICYKDHKVTASSAILKDFTSLYTASALQYLLDEDAIIIGSCNCDEFAMGSTNEHSVYGKVLNGFDETKVPGGSSGGSAVAVQAGMCMCSLGSDTGGSVRQPADFCGVVGLKPGYGTISRYGLLAYASSFDQIGVFSNNVADAALLLDIMSKKDVHDSTMSEAIQENILVPGTRAAEKKRFCMFKDVMEHPSLDPEIRESIIRLGEKLVADGHTVKSVPFDLLEFIVPAYYVLTTAEASSNLSRYDGIRYGHRSAVDTQELDQFYKNNRSEGFGMEVKRRIMLGTYVLSTGYYDAYFSKAQRIRRLLVEKVTEIFTNYDAILMPTVPATAMSFGQSDQDPIAMYLADIFTVFANLTGLPGISLPLFTHSNGMPFGVQVMTNRQQENLLLDISQALMQHHKIVPASLN